MGQTHNCILNLIKVDSESSAFGVLDSLNTTDPPANLLSRINNILGNLTSKSYKDTQSGFTISYMSLAWTIRNGLMSVESFPMLAQAFLDAETLIHNHLPTNNVDEQEEIDVWIQITMVSTI